MIIKYTPYKANINRYVTLIPLSTPVIPLYIKIRLQHFSVNAACTDAKKSGNIKNIKVCLNNAFLISFSSAPILLIVSYLPLSSIQSDNSFNARIADEDIKKMKQEIMGKIIA